MPPKVVVVGAGFGGCTVAQELSASAEAGHVNITVIDTGDTFNFGACGQYCLNRRAKLEDIGWKLSNLQMSKAIQMKLNTSVSSIDSINRIISTSAGETIAYDYLVLATGTQCK